MGNTMSADKRSLVSSRKAKGVLATVLVLILLISVYAYSNTGQRLVDKKIKLGEKYLSELKYDEAVMAFKRVIEINPRLSTGYQHLAEAHFSVGEYEKGLIVLNDAKSIVENPNEISITIGKFYFEAEDYSKALEEFKGITDDTVISPEIKAKVAYMLISTDSMNYSDSFESILQEAKDDEDRFYAYLYMSKYGYVSGMHHKESFEKALSYASTDYQKCEAYLSYVERHTDEADNVKKLDMIASLMSTRDHKFRYYMAMGNYHGQTEYERHGDDPMRGDSLQEMILAYDEAQKYMRTGFEHYQYYSETGAYYLDSTCNLLI